MKKLKEIWKSNERQLIEILVLMISASLPAMLDFQQMFGGYFAKNELSPENYKWFLLSYGNVSERKGIPFWREQHECDADPSSPEVSEAAYRD